MKKVFSALLLTAFAVCINSCALVFQGAKQKVSLSSSTPDAKIYVDGSLVGTNSVSAEVSRKQSHMVEFKKDGCESQTVALDRKLQYGWLALDFWLCLLPMIPDGVTGAWYTMDKDMVTVALNCNVPDQHPLVIGAGEAASQPKAGSKSRVRTNSSKTSAAENMLKVAVFDPTGKDVLDDIRVIVREEVSSAVVNTPGYSVLEREQIDRVLAENKFQASGLVDDNQIGALGRQMGADKVCVTSIAKLGSAYHISCKLVDVATARIESQRTGKTAASGSNIDQIVADIVALMLGN